MQFPINIGLRRSYILAATIAAVHFFAAVGVVATPWAIEIQAALLASLAVSVGWAFLTWRPKVGELRLFKDGRLECRLKDGDESQTARLLPGMTVHPWLTVFRLERGGKIIPVLILPDSASREEFRRLRVWLRWKTDFSGLRQDV